MRDKVGKRTALEAMNEAGNIISMIDQDRETRGFSDEDFEWDNVVDNLIRVIEKLQEKPEEIEAILTVCKKIRAE